MNPWDKPELLTWQVWSADPRNQDKTTLEACFGIKGDAEHYVDWLREKLHREMVFTIRRRTP